MKQTDPGMDFASMPIRPQLSITWEQEGEEGEATKTSCREELRIILPKGADDATQLHASGTARRRLSATPASTINHGGQGESI